MLVNVSLSTIIVMSSRRGLCSCLPKMEYFTKQEQRFIQNDIDINSESKLDFYLTILTFDLFLRVSNPLITNRSPSLSPSKTSI